MTYKPPLKYLSFFFLSVLCFIGALTLKNKEASQTRSKYLELENTLKTVRAGQEGTLWFDAQNKNYVITLGRRNGVSKGNVFKIYDAETVVGEARVTDPREKISIVKIENIDKEKLTRQYYKISAE